jgi:serine/threonine-protein kinase
MIRAADRGYTTRSTHVFQATASPAISLTDDQNESRVRQAVGDDYEILSLLGSGTFGTVWRARDLWLEREVALKVLHPRIARDGEAVSAFWREARLAAQLAHPSIVPIYDWDGGQGLLWYTMELAEGGSVADLVRRAGPRALHTLAPQIESLLDGLHAVHAIGVAHRDLKPENVLIDRYRRWRLTDFGIANVTGEDTQFAAGTPEFAAPEQLLGEAHGPSVDLFALAAIVYYALTGKQPFAGPDPQTILAQQLGQRADLSVLPSDIAEWVAKGLAPTPAERFADAQEMQLAWRSAVRTTRKRERTRRWWRFFIPR